MAISITDNGFLHDGVNYATATVVLPEKAVGAVLVVNQVTQRLERLARVIEDAAGRRAKAEEKAILEGRRSAKKTGAVETTVSSKKEFAGAGVGSGESAAGGGESVWGGIAAWEVGKRMMARAIPMLGRLIPVAAAAYGGFEVYKDYKSGGNIGYGNAAMAGAGIGGMVGSVVPGVGTTVGAGVGAVAGVTGAAIYNNPKSASAGSIVGGMFGGPIGTAVGAVIGGAAGAVFGDDAVQNAWDSVGTKIKSGTDAVVKTTSDAWAGLEESAKSTISKAGEHISTAWTSLKDSTQKYKDSIEDWLSRQGTSVQQWLHGVLLKLEESVATASLRSMAAEWLGALKNWVLAKFGLGGGGKGGADSPAGNTPGGDAPYVSPRNVHQGPTGPQNRGGQGAPQGDIVRDGAPDQFVNPNNAYAGPGLKANPTAPGGVGSGGLKAFDSQGLSGATLLSKGMPDNPLPVDSGMSGVGTIGGASPGMPAMTQFGGSTGINRQGVQMEPTAGAGTGAVVPGNLSPHSLVPGDYSNISNPGNAASLGRVNPNLLTINNEAARVFMLAHPDLRIEMGGENGSSGTGVRSGARSNNHGIQGDGYGGAMDTRIYNVKTGERYHNYQDGAHADLYQEYQNYAKAAQVKNFPEMNIRSGMYFGGGYGRADLMHNDVRGYAGMGSMGDYEHGFSPEQMKFMGMDPSKNHGMGMSPKAFAEQLYGPGGLGSKMPTAEPVVATPPVKDTQDPSKNSFTSFIGHPGAGKFSNEAMPGDAGYVAPDQGGTDPHNLSWADWRKLHPGQTGPGFKTPDWASSPTASAAPDQGGTDPHNLSWADWRKLHPDQTGPGFKSPDWASSPTASAAPVAPAAASGSKPLDFNADWDTFQSQYKALHPDPDVKPWAMPGSDSVVPPTTIKESTGEPDAKPQDDPGDSEPAGSTPAHPKKRIGIDDIPLHSPNTKMSVMAMSDTA